MKPIFFQENMMTKIHLSPQESELVQNAEWILIKQGIIKKVDALFGHINDLQKAEVDSLNYLPEEVKRQNGKISKGENYRQLPYVLLDYPAFFKKENIFAIRTMFWWGNFFSVSLHLSGIYKEQFTQKIADVFPLLQKHDFFICVNEDEWQHHFEEENYIAASAINLQQFQKINEKDFIKISKKISLSQWDTADDFMMDSFREILNLLKISYPGGKKDLLPESPKAGSGL